ncbi:sterol 3beta-glucosyltransferase [Actinomycetospora succinea]|uniref:Sterol 3beta-glucosyltransferase n=1 Tax=Actinomycetospora succinea TaxID=663603 RepID=A0A4R6VAG5_9PSEU|nr:glycosyltransferase [Actinomycetospora succinea]TDQ58937.1 sterol 3beta-glucosyltransferase [Actinomycetospora succinea]
MRVLVTSFGTRGDIQPYLALGGALRARGHDVVLAVPEAFRDEADRVGVRLEPAGSRMLTMLREVMPELRGARDALRTLGVMREAMREHLDEQWAAARAADPEVIVHHPKCLAGPHLAEALGVPGVLSIPLPFYSPTRAFPIPFLGGMSLPGRINRATYAFTRMATVLYGGMINDFRRRLGLGRVGRFADPLRNPDGSPVDVLYPFSRHVVPVPADYPPSAHVTGYWFLPPDPAWHPDARLVDFLAAGEAPVYVGFGSMGFGKGADERRDAVLGALVANRLRGVVATGWGGLTAGDAPSDDVLVVDAVPHDWLFDRVAAVVHHGGAGSTAAGLRAGKPTLVCPFLGDQPFWAARVHALGAGPAPLPAGKLAAGLADRLGDLVGRDDYRERAAEIGQQVRAENGLDHGVRILEDLVGQ